MSRTAAYDNHMNFKLRNSLRACCGEGVLSDKIEKRSEHFLKESKAWPSGLERSLSGSASEARYTE